MKESKGVSPGERIKRLAVGQFATIKTFGGGSGSLQARKLSTGETKLYWRYTHKLAKLRDEIGMWDSSAPPLSSDPTAKGYSIGAASEVCRVRALLHKQGKLTDGWPGHKVRLEAEHAAEKAEQAKARTEEARICEQTFSLLLDTYCEYLKREGRRSHADARSIFQVHVKTAWPTLAAESAASITSERLADIIRKVQEAGKKRTANKLRSYLRAAFQCAATAKYTPKLPASFKSFEVAVNPVTVIPVDTEANKADKNPLSELQLRKYRSALAATDGVKGAALRLHLLTGGQRVEQFVKLLKMDTLADRIVLIDPKGKRSDALRHLVPLTPAAKKEIQFLQDWNAKVLTERRRASEPEEAPAAKPKKRDKKEPDESKPSLDPNPYLVSTDGGATHVSAMTLTRWAQASAKSIPDFQLKRVRSGVETALAKAGVSLDLRGLLQSHGLSSLQRKHYDGHDYVRELKAALLALGRILDKETQANRSRGRARQD